MRQPFHKLLLATSLGNLSDGLFLVALPLYATRLTRDPTVIAGMVFAATLPWLIFSPLAGVFVDRQDRKRIMVWVNSVRCLLLAGLTLSLAFDLANVRWLYLIAFLMGMAEVLFDTASATILPAVVSKAKLEQANNRLLAAQLVTNDFLGKPVGSVLFSLAPWLPFLTQMLAQGVATKTVQTLPGTYKPAQRKGEKPSIWVAIVEGFKWLLGHPTLRTLSLLSVIRNVVEAGASAILVLYVLEVLKLNEAAYGVLLACAAIGAVLATLLTERVLRRFGSGNTLIASIVLAGVSFGVIGLVPNVFIVGSMLALFAMTEVVWGVVSTSFRQAATPDYLLGRVNGSWRLTSRGTRAIGALFGGVVATAFGLTAPFVVMGAVIIVMGFLAIPHLSNQAFETSGRDAVLAGDD